MVASSKISKTHCAIRFLHAKTLTKETRGKQNMLISSIKLAPSKTQDSRFKWKIGIKENVLGGYRKRRIIHKKRRLVGGRNRLR